MRRPTGRLSTLLAVAVLCAAAGCTAADPSTDGEAATPATTSAAETEATVSEPSPAATTPSTPTASPSTTARPEGELAAALARADLLVASDLGVDLVTGGDAQALTSIPARRAYADGAGGVVFQGLAPPQDDAPSAAIMWLPPDGGDAVTVVPDGAADAVTLHDAAVIDGRPTAVYTERSGETPETAEERLMLLPLPDGAATQVAVTGGWESGAPSVSYRGGLVAIQMSASAATWFRFVDVSGEPVAVPSNPLPEEEACVGECPTAMTVGDAGDRIAWAAGATITVADLEDGERHTVALPDSGPDAFVHGLDLVGDRLVADWASASRDGADTQATLIARQAVAFDLASADSDPIEITPAGFATLVGD